jgi:hypothetical protein
MSVEREIVVEVLQKMGRDACLGGDEVRRRGQKVTFKCQKWWWHPGHVDGSGACLLWRQQLKCGLQIYKLQTFLHSHQLC